MSASQKLTALDINSLLADSNGLALMYFWKIQFDELMAGD